MEILIILYLLIGVFFYGVARKMSECVEDEKARDMVNFVAILYLIIWPILVVYGLGRSLASRGLEDEESKESTGEEMGIRD